MKPQPMKLRLFASCLALFFAAAANPPPASARVLPDFADLVEKKSAAVVSVRASARPRAAQERQRQAQPWSPLPPNHPFFRFLPPEFFGAPPQQRNAPRSAQGSGFVISGDGYVLTNAHVIANADDVFVSLHDGREFTATIVGSDDLTDIALLKIESEDALPTMQIGDSDKLRVGEWVLAIGSPYQLDQTVTAGIVSAIGRRLPSEVYVPFIQTDAAVNPGNSGGPLINQRGDVIGINSQILSRTGAFAGISFAIPINLAMDIQARLREDGKIERGRLGIYFGAVDPDAARAFGMDEAKGALVNEIIPNSAAETGGVQTGDIILSFDGDEVSDAGSLPGVIGGGKPGRPAPLVVLREGERLTLTVILDSLEATTLTSLFGLRIEDIDAETARESGLREGVVVVGFDLDEDSPADIQRLQINDIIVGALIDRKLRAIENKRALIDLLSAVDSGTIVFQIVRDNRREHITINLDK